MHKHTQIIVNIREDCFPSPHHLDMTKGLRFAKYLELHTAQVFERVNQRDVYGQSLETQLKKCQDNIRRILAPKPHDQNAITLVGIDNSYVVYEYD